MGIASAAWREVGDGVLVRRYPFLDQSIGIVLGPEGVLVVDTRSSAGQAEEIRRAVRELTALPIVAAVDTHHHWDHSFGNRALRPIPIWGHARCARRLVESAEAMREAHAAEAPGIGEVVVDPPDRTFEEHAVVEITGRRVELRYLGRGHTDDDIVALVTDAGILFAGDLLENGAPPWYGDAYPLDWPETASRLLELVRGPVVPGHGEPGDRAFVEDQVSAIVAIAELGRRVHRGELGMEDAVAAGPYDTESTREAIERALRQLRGELD